MLSEIQAIVLAAGKSTRLNSNKTKLIEKICGQELILYPIAILNDLSISTTLVIGFQGETIKKIVEQRYPQQVQFIQQDELRGTADAVKQTRDHWHADTILIIKADVPLISSTIIETLYQTHKKSNATISFVAAHNEDPADTQRRVITDKKKIYIRELAELNDKEIQKNCYITGGIYVVSRDFLQKAIDLIALNNSTQEYHISDLVNIATNLGKKVSMTIAPFDQVRGVDTYQELWAVEQIKRSELIRHWMARGVRFVAAQNVHIDLDVQIGAGSVIGNSVHLLTGTNIGTNSIIHAFSILQEAIIGNHVIIHPHSIITKSTIGDHTHVGPFAHIQTDTCIGNHCAIGNFVETKRTHIGDHTKAKHLTYLGDAQIGSEVNIGAGTIICNYNGKIKQVTHIEDKVFIGSNNSLVAPVTIGTGSFTAAGSVITENVPPQALAIARARQVNKEGYAQKMVETISATDEQENEQPLSFGGATRSSIADL